MTKEERKEYYKRWYQENKEKHNRNCEKYNEEHKQVIKEYHKLYYNTKVGRSKILYLAYKNNDAKKGFDTSNNISDEWILENIFGGKCFYCGENDWTKLGADRIDNSKPHTPDNVICSCWECNRKRKDKYTVEEFKELMTKQ